MPTRNPPGIARLARALGLAVLVAACAAPAQTSGLEAAAYQQFAEEMAREHEIGRAHV